MDMDSMDYKNDMDDMNDLGFLSKGPPGKAALHIITGTGQATIVRNINHTLVLDSCPVFGHSFEDCKDGSKRSSMEVSRVSTAICFLRYLYNGNYMLEADGLHEEPQSLLINAELHYLAIQYDMPDLARKAILNLNILTNLFCSLPMPPPDLCLAIQHMYSHLPQQQALKDIILPYCVACFNYHRLAHMQDFKDMALNLSPFLRDLCQMNMQRDFTDESALMIIRFPTPPGTIEEDRSSVMEEIIRWSHDISDASDISTVASSPSPYPQLSHSPEAFRGPFLNLPIRSFFGANELWSDADTDGRLGYVGPRHLATQASSSIVLPHRTRNPISEQHQMPSYPQQIPESTSVNPSRFDQMLPSQPTEPFPLLAEPDIFDGFDAGWMGIDDTGEDEVLNLSPLDYETLSGSNDLDGSTGTIGSVPITEPADSSSSDDFVHVEPESGDGNSSESEWSLVSGSSQRR